MKLRLRKADEFLMDFSHLFRWFERESSPELASRFLESVDATLENLSLHPGLGWSRTFRHPSLIGIHSCLVARPFSRYLIFYRFDASTLHALRIMHDARNLRRRLLEPGLERE
jgi:plasmid stabilization system protein ParE